MATVRHDPGPDRERAIDELRSEGLDVLEFTDEAGASYPEHSHPGREVRYVLEGSMTIRTSDGAYRLGPGARIELEPDESHRAIVGPDGVRYLAGTSR